MTVARIWSATAAHTGCCRPCPTAVWSLYARAAFGARPSAGRQGSPCWAGRCCAGWCRCSVTVCFSCPGGRCASPARCRPAVPRPGRGPARTMPCWRRFMMPTAGKSPARRSFSPGGPGCRPWRARAPHRPGWTPRRPSSPLPTGKPCCACWRKRRLWARSGTASRKTSAWTRIWAWTV